MSGTIKPHFGMNGTVKTPSGTSGTIKPHFGTSGTVKPHFGTGGTVKPPPTHPFTFRSDRLGKLASSATDLLCSGMSFPALCSAHRGPSSLVDPCLLPHPAAPLLSYLRDYGASVGQSSDSWTEDQRDLAMRRGPHPSAKGNETFIREEFADMIAVGHWLALPYELVKTLPALRLSPTGVVPQKERRDRIIVDYTFSGVNQATSALAPDSLQFGHAFTRYLQQLHRADTRHGPVYMSKTDVADAFMQIWIELHSIPILAALLPTSIDETPLVAFPMVLPMGWVNSPNYLCAITETICDITNDRLTSNLLNLAPHHLSALADSPADLVATRFPTNDAPRIHSRGPLQRPTNFTDVYMDDFIMASQLPPRLRTATRDTLFHCIDSVLRPLAPGDIAGRKEPNSTKKLQKGDAAWSTVKIILGWKIDTLQRTIELPTHRAIQLKRILDMNSSVIQALLMQPCQRVFPPVAAPWQLRTPTSGTASVNNISWTPTSPLAPIQSRGCKSSLSEFATAGFQPVANLSDLAQWRTRSMPSRRHSPCWATPTPNGLQDPTLSTPASADSCEASPNPMHLPPA